MRHLHMPFRHHFHQVAITQLVRQVPPHTQGDNFVIKVTAFEQLSSILVKYAHPACLSARFYICSGTLRRRFPAAAKLTRGVTEFDTYIRNNQKFIPNFGERYRQGDTISTAFVEFTVG
jgi:hypothetical protein